jgi:nicotinamide-nucleotide amidase
MRIEIVTIGDELLLGNTIDTNGAHIARELASIGVEVGRRTSVGDDAADIADAVRAALERTGAVITTGGLGPTADDLTKQSIAALFGRGVHVDETLLAALAERWHKRFGTELPVANRKQVEIPDGAGVLANRHGSAPGIWLEDEHARWVAMLPGVPREMRGMLADTLLPLLRERLAARGVNEPPVIRSRTVRTTGVAESAIPERLGDLARGFDGLSLAYLPGYEGVDLRLTSRGRAHDAAAAALDDGARRVRERMGRHVYGEDAADLAAVVLDRCRDAGLTLAVAESCTGGLLGTRLTAIAGSSDVVVGGAIAYANDVKVRHLGVSPDDLAAHGAVSEPVVRQMARGARERFGASIGVGITGIAGPGGGTPEKPVGTVWVCVDREGREPYAVRAALIGDRAEIRQRAAQQALAMLLRVVDEPSSAG